MIARSSVRTFGIRPARRAGLSLLEVLVSMAIFLIALGAIASLVDVGSERAMSASMTNLGTRLAQSKLAEIEAGLTSPSSAESGSFEDEPDWTYSVEPGAALAANTYPVTVRCTRELNGRKHEVVLTQVIFDPALQGKGAAATKPTATTAGSGS